MNIEGIITRDRIRNGKIRENLELFPLWEKIKNLRLKIIGYIIIKGKSTKLRKSLEMTVDGTKPEGRPQT